MNNPDSEQWRRVSAAQSLAVRAFSPCDGRRLSLEEITSDRFGSTIDFDVWALFYYLDT